MLPRGVDPGMTSARVELRSDHLVLHLEGPAAAPAPRRDVVVPFSDIVGAQAAPPRWPSITGQWQIATYVPGVLAVGDFHEWNGHRRLLAIDRGTKQALTLRLAGHPAYDEICVEAEDAASLAARLGGANSAPWTIAPRE